MELSKRLRSELDTEEVQRYLQSNAFPHTLSAFKQELEIKLAEEKQRIEAQARLFEAAAAASRNKSCEDDSQAGNATWICQECSKIFTTKGSLKRHFLSTHTAETKPFLCPLCDLKFARRDDMYTHMRRIHDAESEVQRLIAETKIGGHRGRARTKLIKVVNHLGHFDVVLPSGDVICRMPDAAGRGGGAAQSAAAAASESVSRSKIRTRKRPSAEAEAQAAAAADSSSCDHWRVMHDDHEDVVINGSLHHKNPAGEWELHGELGMLDDLEVLLMNNSGSPSSTTFSENSRGTSGGGTDVAHYYPSMRTAPLVLSRHDDHVDVTLPGGSILCRRSSPEAILSDSPTLSANGGGGGHSHSHHLANHVHSENCGHTPVVHGSHVDYLVGSAIHHHSSTTGQCDVHGSIALPQGDSLALTNLISLYDPMLQHGHSHAAGDESHGHSHAAGDESYGHPHAAGDESHGHHAMGNESHGHHAMGVESPSAGESRGQLGAGGNSHGHSNADGWNIHRNFHRRGAGSHGHSHSR